VPFLELKTAVFSYIAEYSQERSSVEAFFGLLRLNGGVVLEGHTS
jgi:hypothetical protein